MDNLKLQALINYFDYAADRFGHLAAKNYFQRPIYSVFQNHLARFVAADQPQSRWLIVSGLRGVGKTTILAQLSQDPLLANPASKFILSFDELSLRGVSTVDLTAALELKLGCRLFEVPDKLFLFLDEIHFLPDWSVGLKTIYDSCRQLFMVCTGSSALNLNLNPDSGRRADMIRIPPLNFSEYLLIEAQTQARINSDSPGRQHLESVVNHLQAYFKSDLPQQLYQVLFQSETGVQVDSGLKQLEPSLTDYWRGFGSTNSKDLPRKATIDRAIVKYISQYMTLPDLVAGQYTDLELINQPPGRTDFFESIVYLENFIDNLNQTETTREKYAPKRRLDFVLGAILINDLEVLGRFEPKTRGQIIDFLRLLANADSASLATMARNLTGGRTRGPSINTLQDIIRVLLAAEVIIGVAPFGSGFGRVNRPYKYLFTAPALRSALSPLTNLTDSSLTDSSGLRGRLLEDTVGLYLYHLAASRSAWSKLEYDAKSGGADFIQSHPTDQKQILTIEVGWNKTSHRQVSQTLKRLKRGNYGLVVAGNRNQSKLSQDRQAVYVPLQTFLLL